MSGRAMTTSPVSVHRTEPPGWARSATTAAEGCRASPPRPHRPSAAVGPRPETQGSSSIGSHRDERHTRRVESRWSTGAMHPGQFPGGLSTSVRRTGRVPASGRTLRRRRALERHVAATGDRPFLPDGGSEPCLTRIIRPECHGGVSAATTCFGLNRRTRIARTSQMAHHPGPELRRGTPCRGAGSRESRRSSRGRPGSRRHG